MPKLTKTMFKHKYFRSTGYVPHPRQREFHNSTARFRTAVCGRRFGKSYMTGKDLGAEMMGTPNGVFWIVAPTYDLGEKEFRVVWDDLIRKKKLGDDPDTEKAYTKRGNMYIRLPNNSYLEVKTADNTDGLNGEGLDGVVVAEAAKLPDEIFKQYLRPALADKKGWCVITTTPEGRNWVHDIYKKGKDPAYPHYESWTYPSWENTTKFPLGRDDPEILDMEDVMSEEEFRQEIGASFNSFVHGIFPEFSEDIHVRTLEFNPNWPNYQFWDFGFVGATVCLDVQVDPFDRVYVWREYYETGQTLNDTIRALKDRDNPEGYHIANSFGDAGDPDAIETICQEWAPCIGDGKAKDDWKQGIFHMKRFLKVRKDNLPGILFDPRCYDTLKEIPNYRSGSKNTKGIIVTEKPVKKDDHAVDAIRYGLNHLFVLGATSHLEDVMDAYNVSATGTESEVETVTKPHFYGIMDEEF